LIYRRWAAGLLPGYAPTLADLWLLERERGDGYQGDDQF